MCFDKDKLRAVPIVEVAKKLDIAIKKTGANFLMQCLWHEDKKPSMILRSSNNRCHCFACGENSDAVGLVMKAHNINFKEACEWLEREGYEIREAPLPAPPKGASPPSPLSHEARGNPSGGGMCRHSHAGAEGSPTCPPGRTQAQLSPCTHPRPPRPQSPKGVSVLRCRYRVHESITKGSRKFREPFCMEVIYI